MHKLALPPDCLFQSTLPVRGATATMCRPLFRVPISIHAPREGSDTFFSNLYRFTSKFQSTLPVRGATSGAVKLNYAKSRFQSTLPVRGATRGRSNPYREPLISIHAPREGSDKSHLLPPLSQAISIHAPREGSDSKCA